MKAVPVISVVTACFNAVDFIEQCLQSVIAQELAGVEHVVVDGGSTDGTVDIIKRCAGNLTYWHSIPDRGIGHAFNLGIEHSRGEWLLFLNADDYLCRSDALRVLASGATSGTADVVYGRVQPVTRQRDPRPLGEAVGWPYSRWSFLLKDLIPHPAALTSRAYLDRVGRFREDLSIALDYELYLRSYRTLRTVFTPEVVSHMRVGGRSADQTAALREMFRAQCLHRVLPPAARFLLRAAVRSKAALGRLVRPPLEAAAPRGEG